MNQQALLKHLAKCVLSIKKNHPIRVGIDGVDASGKTTIANALADFLKAQNQNVIRASVDGFHNPKSIRYQHGRNSPEGYYKDSFNNQAIITNLLAPLGERGDLKYRKTIFDFKTDKEVISPIKTAKLNSILIMDGVFLFRPELIKYWDLKIFIDADFAITTERAIERDGYYLGSKEEIIEKYTKRYVPGQKLYFKEANPKKVANIIIDNNDFENPIVVIK